MTTTELLTDAAGQTRGRVRRGAAIVLTCLMLLTACGTQKVSSGSDGNLPILHIGQSSQALGAPAAMDKIAAGQWVFNGTAPATPRTGPVLKYDSSAVTEADVTGLAASLGLTAAPTKHAHGWDVTDGKATLQVRDSGEWAYAREAGPCNSVILDLDSVDGSNGVACASASAVSSDGTVTSSATSTGIMSGGSGGVSVNASADSSGIVPPAASAAPASPIPGPTPATSVECGPAVDCIAASPVACADTMSCPVSSVPSIPDSQALAAVAPVITAAHLEGSPYVAAWGGSPATVLLDPTVAGLPTFGLQTSFGVDDKGIVNAYGRMGNPSQAGQYPVVSTTEALKTLNAMPRPMMDIACPVETNINPSASAAPVPLPACGTPAPMVLTKATFGLQLQWDGADTLLVPAWLFTAEGATDPSNVISAIAVDPAYIAAPTPPAPNGSVLPSAIAVPPVSASSGAIGGSAGSPAPAPTATVSSTVSAQSYSITTESVLTVHFWGGDCSTYSGVAKESDKTIAVFITETPNNSGAMCDAMAKATDVVVKLSAPIGSRQVVDGASGTAIPLGDTAK